MPKHIPVLLKEVLENLEIGENDTVLDATLGNGGHSVEIAKLLGAGGILIGLDVDKDSLARATETLKGARCKKYLLQANFRKLDQALGSIQIPMVNKILFDLGWNMDQFAEEGRGFSFQVKGPLDMRLSTEEGESEFTAGDIVNDWEESSLIDIFTGYGEEKQAKKIAQAIIIARSEKRIESTVELAEIIAKAFGGRRSRIHPATRIFQALRIAVNDELSALREGLALAYERLSKGGRMAVISFHSLEDRIVKRFLIEKQKAGLVRLINKKPIAPSEEELLVNRRSRSAKLRVAEKM